MKLGIDIDGVLCDFIGPLLKRHNREYGTNHSICEIDHFHKITELGISFGLWDFQHVEVMPGAKEILEVLNQEHELYIVTARPTYTAHITHDWLYCHFPFLTEQQLIMCHNKQLINVDCMVDDGIHNLEGFPYVVVYNQPWNKNASFWRANDWVDVYNLVEMFGIREN